jgi:tetratricopeptide (TPR) repeat protein
MENRLLPRLISQNPEFVIFAGAGCSMAPPSSLPNWNDLNNAIIEVLWDRLEQHKIRDRHREKLISDIRQKRDENLFPPDYQAQLMAERVGIQYFQLLSAVDSDSFNAVQYFTSLLAKSGKVKAVLTTNFDQNFERAFQAQKIEYISCFDEEGFNKVSLDGSQSGIPIIKIHGCSSAPESMIDTSKQRLQGRSKSLEKAITGLLGKYHFLICGFSGADFDENRNYLGFRDAAASAIGFSYFYFPGTEVRKSIADLMQFYGNKKATAIEADPALILEEMIQLSGIKHDPFSPVSHSEKTFRDKLAEKASGIEPMDTFNMLAALAESFGDEVSARYLYDKVWRNRSGRDYTGESFSRFLLNHGRSYVFNFQDVYERANAAGISISNNAGSLPPHLQEVYANPAKQNLFNDNNIFGENKALIALDQTLEGNPEIFSSFPDSMKTELESSSATTRADIYYYYSFYALAYRRFNEGISFLDQAISDMELDCDEPRLSQLLARRSMLLVDVGRREEAEIDARKARLFAEKYHEPRLLAESALALAKFARITRNYKSALETVVESVERFKDLRRRPQLFEAIIEYFSNILSAMELDPENRNNYHKLAVELIGGIDIKIIDCLPLFRPDYFFLSGLFMYMFTDSAHYVEFLAKALIHAENINHQAKMESFRMVYEKLNILGEIQNYNLSIKE